MKESTRRAVIFVVIVGGGSVMIIFDLPTFYLVLGIAILGLLLLFLTGAIKVPTMKLTGKTRAENPVAAKEASKKASPAKEKKPKKEKVKSPNAGDSSGSFIQAFSVLKLDMKKFFRSSREKTTHTKKIDEMLEKSIKGEEVSSLENIVPELALPQKKGISDPFSELVKDPLNPDLINDLPLDGDISVMDEMDLSDDFSEGVQNESRELDVSHLDIELSGNESPIAVDEEEDDEVADILAAHQDLLDEDEDAEVDPFSSGLDGLGDIDLGEIDLDQEDARAGGEPAKEDRPVPGGSAPLATPVGTSSLSPAPVLGAGGGGPGGRSDPNELDMVSFSTGHREDDDLMASLKSDVKGVKRQNNISLLRDLKDVRVPASDLEKELEGIVRAKKQRE
jgi:hypothetical protein